MSNHYDLLQLFKQRTGTTIHIPKPVANIPDMQIYFPEKRRTYFAQSNQFQRWK
jgi:hypothetical protein